MPGEPRPSLLSDYKDTKYSFPSHLDNGHHRYHLRSLGDNRNDDQHYLVPEEVRPIFMRLVLDRLAPCGPVVRNKSNPSLEVLSASE